MSPFQETFLEPPCGPAQVLGSCFLITTHVNCLMHET